MNHYAIKKSAAQSMLDVALLMANSSQLKTVLHAGPNKSFYIPLILLISLSITLQIIVGVLLVFIGQLIIILFILILFVWIINWWFLCCQWRMTWTMLGNSQGLTAWIMWPLLLCSLLWSSTFSSQRWDLSREGEIYYIIVLSEFKTICKTPGPEGRYHIMKWWVVSVCSKHFYVYNNLNHAMSIFIWTSVFFINLH